MQGTDLTGLDNEPGGHRIQRIPPTERKGRVHTSTVTVAVLDPCLPQTQIREQDLKIEWYSGTGAGGQHKNKKMCSCRITHIPTGIIATAQTRERPNSYKLARADVESKVIRQQIEISDKSLGLTRKHQIGSGMRGDKIRTYRFQDDVTQDHRSGQKDRTSSVMKGNFEKFWIK